MVVMPGEDGPRDGGGVVACGGGGGGASPTIGGATGA